MLQNLSIHWQPLIPAGQIALAVAVLMGLLALGCLLLRQKNVPPRWVAILAALRVMAIILFVLCLLQPTLSYLGQVAKPPELLVLVDTSQSMGLPGKNEQGTRLSETVASLQNSELLPTLTSRFRPHWFSFDRQASPMDAKGLMSLQSRGTSTNYARSLVSAIDFLHAGSDPQAGSANIQRVLLISDGHDRGGEDLADAARRLGVTIDTIAAVGARLAEPNAEPTIERVQSARRVLLGSETQFWVTLLRGSAPTTDFMLVLYEDGNRIQRKDVKFEEKNGELQIRLTHRPMEAGLKRYAFALEKKSELKDDAAKAETLDEEKQNRYEVNVQVLDNTVEVLVLEDRWRWEFKYLRRVIEDDPTYNFTAMLARGGSFVQFGEPERKVDLGGFPQGRAEIDWFDVIVLGDVRPSRWPKGLSGSIADAVLEGGKSLVLVAGPNLHELAQVPELHSLLPVELSRESAEPIEGPVELRVTPEGVQSSFLSKGGTGGAIRELPPLDFLYPPLRKRPAATVLVEAAEQGNAAGRLITVAEQTVGRGRVLYVGSDTLWKWQTASTPDEQGQTVYNKFWQQAFRALTPSRAAANKVVWLQPDRSRYEAGDQVTLRAELGEEQAAEDVSLQAVVVLPDERRVSLAFNADPTTLGAYNASFDARLPGRYRISLSALVEGEPIAEASAAIEVTAARSELEARDVDRAALERIAQRTGGRLVDPQDKQTWPDLGERAIPLVSEMRSVNLWENFTLVVLLCLVLGGDWLLRLLRGFV